MSDTDGEDEDVDNFQEKIFSQEPTTLFLKERDRSSQPTRLPPDQIFAPKFSSQNDEISLFIPASMESPEAGKKPMLDNHPMF